MQNFQFSSNNFNELVFENRNKSYGAYILRKEYDERLTKAFLITLLSILLFLASFAFLNQKCSETIVPNTSIANEQLVIEINIAKPKELQKPLVPIQVDVTKLQTPASKTELTPVVSNDVKIEEENKKPEIIPSASSNSSTSVNVSTTPSTVELNTSSSIALITDEEAEPINFAALDEAPVFPGGENELMNFLAHHINYPMLAKENGIAGTVYVSFKVNKFGKVIDINLKKGLFAPCDEEVIRVIKLFPDWKPGLYQGKAVSVILNLPVRFDLRN